VTLRIIEGTEPIEISTVAVKVYSLPGIGKSTLGYTAEEPLTLDFDHGAHRAKGRKRTVSISSWSEVDELLRERRLLADHKTFVVDTAGRCLDLCSLAIMDENAKMGTPSSGLSQKGWGLLKYRFASLANTLRGMGKDVVFLAHAKEEKDGDSRVMRPDLQGGSYAEVSKIADLIGYLYMSGRQRFIDFNPTDGWVGKNPVGWPARSVPDVAENPRFLADLIAEAKTAMSSLSEESSKLAAKVDEWRSAIEGIEDGDGLLRAAETIKGEPTIVRAQVKALFKARAEALGLKYDATTKVYVKAA
jgi:hypothetical protein